MAITAEQAKAELRRRAAQVELRKRAATTELARRVAVGEVQEQPEQQTRGPLIGESPDLSARPIEQHIPISDVDIPDQPIESRTGAPIPSPEEEEMQQLVRQLGEKGAFVAIREQKAAEASKKVKAGKKEFKGLRTEASDALARGIANTTAGGLDALERVSESSIFPPGFFSKPAEILREIAKDADIQPATLAKGATKRRKAGAFVANAVGETLPFMAASIGSTLLTGTPLAAFATSFTIEGENARQDALEAGASDEDADMEAFVVGTINGALESLQVDEILKFSGIGKASKKALIEAVRQKSIKKLAKETGKIGLATLKTAVTEGIQEGLQETTSILAPGLSGRELPSKEEAFKRIGGAVVGGAVVGPILGGGVAIATPGQVTQDTGDQVAETAPVLGETQQVLEQLRDATPDKDGFQAITLDNADEANEVAANIADLAEQSGSEITITAEDGVIKFREGAEIADKQVKPPATEAVETKPVVEEVKVVKPVEAKQGAVVKKVAVKPKVTPVKPDVTKPVTAESVQKQPKVTPEASVTKTTAKNVEEAVKVDVTDPAFPTSTKHDSTKEIRERLGIGQVNSKTRRSDEQAMSEAIENKIPEKAKRIADEINVDARALSDIEDAGMRIAVAELEIEHEQLMDLVGETEDEADIKTLSAEAERVENELDAILTALETSGSEAGRALRARRVQIGRDFKLTSVLNRAKAATGKKLSAAKRAIFKGLDKRLKAAEKKIKVLEAKVAEQKANKQFKRGAKRFTSLNTQQRRTTIASLANDVNILLKQGCAN